MLENKRVTAFTLIELLVVIAIIAILASILFPVFARARENARRSNCMSNLKQIALGIMQYNQDYDEKMPQQWQDRDGNGSWNPSATIPDQGWGQLVQPYLKSTQIFQCPSETAWASGNATGSNGYNDYYINLLAANKTIAAFDSPSITVLLGEGGSDSAASGNDGCGGTGATTSTAVIGDTKGSCTSTFTNKLAIIKSTGTGTKVNTAIRHLDGSNFAFADGHVKWYKGTDDGAVSATATMSSIMSGATAPGNAPSFKIASPSL